MCGKPCGDRCFSCHNFLTLQHFQQNALAGGIFDSRLKRIESREFLNLDPSLPIRRPLTSQLLSNSRGATINNSLLASFSDAPQSSISDCHSAFTACSSIAGRVACGQHRLRKTEPFSIAGGRRANEQATTSNNIHCFTRGSRIAHQHQHCLGQGAGSVAGHW